MSVIYWIIGILTGLAGQQLCKRVKADTLGWKWYHWVIAFLWYISVIMVVSFIGQSFREGMPKAGGMSILIFGGILLVVTIVLLRLVYYKSFFPNKA